MSFGQLALLIESTTTLEIVKALLYRFESYFMLSQAIAATTSLSSWNNVMTHYESHIAKLRLGLVGL